MNPSSPTSFVAERRINSTRPLGRLITILMTGLGVAVVAFVLGWVGRKGTVKIISDWADRPYAAGEFASAAQRYSWVLSLDAQHLHSRVNRATAYHGLNQTALANADWQTCAKAQPRTDAEYTLRAECHLQLGQPREALADLNHELAAYPDDADAFAMRARAQAQLKQWQPALADVTQAMSLQPVRAEFALQRSELRERAGDLAGALEDATRAVQLQQSAPLPAALLRRARLLKQTNNLLAAATAYDEVIVNLVAHESDDAVFAATVLQERAQLRLALGLLDGALTDAEAALKLMPNDAMLRLRARIYRSADKLELALRDLDDLLARNPDDVKLLRMRADVHRSLGHVDAMQQDWLHVIALEPDNAQAFVELGVSEWRQDLTEEALRHLSRAIQLNTTDADAFATRGRIELEQSQMADALSDLTQALALRSNDVATLMVRGKVYEIQNQVDQAQVDFDRAAQLAPDNAQVFVARGRFFVRQNKPTQALPDLQKAATLLTDAPAMRGQMLHEQALVLEALGRLSEAQTRMEQVRALLPDDASALKYLAKLLQKQGKLDEASAALKTLQTLQATADVATQLRVAGLLEKQGKFDEALVAYTSLLSQTMQLLQPLKTQDRIGIYVRMGKVQYGLQRYAGSLTNYEAALKLDQTRPEVFLGIGLNRRKLGYACGAARSFRLYLKLAPDATQRDELLGWLGRHPEC